MAAILMFLAAAAAPTGLTASAPYRAYRQCVIDGTIAADHAGLVPEDLLPRLAEACADQRAALVAEVKRGGYAKLAPAKAEAKPAAGEAASSPTAEAPADGAADANADERLAAPWTTPLLLTAAHRYQVRYTTGGWPRG